MPKLSASVNTSLASPLHCLEIFPTWFWPSAESTLKVQKQQACEWLTFKYVMTYLSFSKPTSHIYVRLHPPEQAINQGVYWAMIL